MAALAVLFLFVIFILVRSLLKTDDKLAVKTAQAVGYLADSKFYKTRNEKIEAQNVLLMNRNVDLEFENDRYRNDNASGVLRIANLEKELTVKGNELSQERETVRRRDNQIECLIVSVNSYSKKSITYMSVLRDLVDGTEAPKHNYKKWAKKRAAKALSL